MTAGDVSSPAPSTRGPSAPFGNLDQPYAGWMCIKRRIMARNSGVFTVTSDEVRTRNAPSLPPYNRRIMTANDKQTRTPPISWRPPSARRAEFDALVAESGLSQNAFLTEAVFARGRHRKSEMLTLARILGQAQTQSDLLRGFESAARMDPEIRTLLAEIFDQQAEIRTALFLLMGRKP